MSVIPLPLAAQDDVRDRAVRLFTFLREYTQLRASTALTADSYDEVIWLADVRCCAAGEYTPAVHDGNAAHECAHVQASVLGPWRRDDRDITLA